MNQKKKLRKVISYVLAFVMVLSTFTGIVPGMSLTAYAASATYIDGSGTSQTVDATVLEAATTNWTNGSWYIVPAGDLTISGRITVNGTVNLILRDGATLTASAGITTTNATLNIYAQSGGTGALTATGSNGSSSTGGSAGIGGVGGGDYSDGGSGGIVNIYGGIVTATGGTAGSNAGGGAGIGGGGGGFSGSGGAGGTVSIFGGTVTATGGAGDVSGGAGAGIGGGGKGRRRSDGASGTLTLGKGVKLYNGTNNTGTVLDENDSENRTYNSNRSQNMFAEFISVGPNKTALNTAIAEATTFSGTLTGDDYSLVKEDLDTAITAATTVKDDADATQEDVDAAVTALNKVLTEAKSSKNIISFIRGLDEAAPDMVITVDEQREGIKQNAAAFDALSDDAKANIPAAVQSTLAAYIAAVNGYEFGEYKKTMKNEADGKAQEDDSDAATAFITAAKEAIDGLTYNAEKTLAENKAAVDAIITQLEKDLADQRAADPVITMINELPSSEEVTTGDQTKIEAARDAYDYYLTGDQKSKVTAETLKKLTDAEDALAAAKVSDEIAALKKADEVTTSDKEAIEAARKDYDALKDAQKYVSADTLKKLTDAEEALKELTDKAAADSVTDVINKLPASDKVATTDKAAIEAARKAYDALTADQKKKVTADTLKKLTDAETALTAAEKKEADDTDAAKVSGKNIA